MFLKKFLLTLVFTFANLVSLPQNQDSLWRAYLNKNNHDTVRLQTLHTFAITFAYTDIDSCLALAKKELAEANKAASLKHEALALGLMGNMHLFKSQHSEALDAFLKSLSIAEKKGYYSLITSSCNNIGNIYLSESKFPKALGYYLKCLKSAEKHNDGDALGGAYDNIGIVYERQENYKKALENYLKGLEILTKQGSSRNLAICYSLIGIVHSKQNNYDSAMVYYSKALKVYEVVQDPGSLAACYVNIATICEAKRDYKNMLYYSQMALNISKKFNLTSYLTGTYISLSSAAGALRKFDQSKLYMDTALYNAKKSDDLHGEYLAMVNLAELNYNMGDYKEAYLNHKRAKIISDTMFNADNSKQMGDLKTQFEVEKKETELKAEANAREIVNAAEKRRQQTVIYFVAGALLIVLIFSTLLYKRFKLTTLQKRVIEEKEQETQKQNEIITVQKHMVVEKQKEILDSIQYARRIQMAQIPSEKRVTGMLNRLRNKQSGHS